MANLQEDKVNFDYTQSYIFITEKLNGYLRERRAYKQAGSLSFSTFALDLGCLYRSIDNSLNMDGIATASIVGFMLAGTIGLLHYRIYQIDKAIKYLEYLNDGLESGRITSINYELLSSRKKFKVSVNEYCKSLRHKQKSKKLLHS